MDLARFLTVPEVDRDNFQNVCGRLVQMNEENDTQEDLMDDNICVMLFDKHMNKAMAKTVEQFQENHL